MKRRALLGHLQEHGCVPFREGGSHSPAQRNQKFLARSICRNLSVPVPPGD
jgi:hypothetical protein